MNDGKPRDMAEVIRHLATVKTTEPSNFKMSDRNRKKWLALQRKARELRGG